MSFWGSTIDPSKAIHYSQRPRPVDEELPDPIFEEEPSTSLDDYTTSFSIPTTTSSTTTIIASTTKQYAKPTEHLPDDHDKAEGESHQPAFPDAGNNKATSDPVASPSLTPTPDPGFFSGMADLLYYHTWLYGGLGFGVLLGLGAGAFFWRRRYVRSRGEYMTVADDELAMTPILHGGEAAKATDDSGRRDGTKEPYDAFGEVSDEDDDNEMGAGSRRPPNVGLGYHDGFLDDDSADPSVARYRDEPTPEERAHVQTSARERNPESASGSGSGSWADAHTSDTEA